MKRKFTALILVATLTMTMLVGCGNSSSPDSKGTSDSPSPATSSDGAPITIRLSATMGTNHQLTMSAEEFAISIMYITMPIVFPLMTGLGYNGIWFGVFVTLLMEMALITPPVGLNSFVIQGISKEPMAKVIRGVLPFMLLLALGLALLYLFPELALWLPSEMA